MARKDLSEALNGFLSVLIEQELEPIRLDFLRIENELKDEIEELKDEIEELKDKISELEEKCK